MNQLGQLVMTGISGTSLLPEEAEFLESENIGGVILFANNYENPAQLAELVNSIQQARSEYPLFIAVDNEGGRVFRFKSGFTQLPSMYDVGLMDSPKLCYHIAKIMADELNACGVNLNFAPVCDIWTNPKNKVIGDRAFGKDEETVSKFVSSIIRGLQTNGVLSCAKHFPGHGCTTKDSHFDLPIVKRSMEELESEEFKPFTKAIKSRVEFVMMAHLVVDAIDPKLPTSLSPKAYSLLREELKFNRLIITDDMEMKAITDNYEVGEAAAMAIEAGADIIEYRSMDLARLALEGLKEAKKTKRIKNDHFNQVHARIMSVKKEYLSEYKPVYIPEISKQINTGASQTFIKEITEKIELIHKQEEN
jgi:beta-N-acetylhexosaminidase